MTKNCLFQIIVAVILILPESHWVSADDGLWFNGTAATSNGTMRNASAYKCNEPSKEDMEFYGDLVWWVDGIVQIVVGVIGLAGNFVAVPILLSKQLSSIFNRILVCLAIFDNIFIFCSLLEAIRKNFGPIHELFHLYVFAYFLYQLQSVAIVSSIFTTVVLALERFLAVSKPIEYHNAVQGTNPWRRVTNYIVPVFTFSAVFNIPKWLETIVVQQTVEDQSFDSETNTTTVTNQTLAGVFPTDLRLDLDYIFYYNNLAKLLFTGILPFVSLCFFNSKIFLALRKRRQLMGSAAVAAHAQQLTMDKRQAVVLSGIVVIFLTCNTPRVVLNFHEVFTIQDYKEALNHNCHSLQLWVLLTGNFSQLCMIVNSSINFFVYCLMSSLFREVLKEKVILCYNSLPCKKDFSIIRYVNYLWQEIRGCHTSELICFRSSPINGGDMQNCTSSLEIGTITSNPFNNEIVRNGLENIEMKPLIANNEQ